MKYLKVCLPKGNLVGSNPTILLMSVLFMEIELLCC